jgi:transposase InsO family protein
METELGLVNLKKELPNVALPVLIKIAREKNIIHADYKASPPTIYRIFRRHGVDKIETQKEDRRRFESELPNDMWQSDCMHGPCVQVDGKEKKSYLFSFIDDHSRLIPYGEFYLQENLIMFMECLKNALLKRGIPKKLYVDNGPTFRSHHLSNVMASLGIALIHARPYQPEGKGKIERFHRTIRMQVLPLVPQKITLDELNKKFQNWVDNEYHTTVHSVTKQSPLKRYLKHLHLIRSAPADLTDYFRVRTLRKVDKDRTIALNGKVYEAPTGLIGNTVTLMYQRDDTEKIEIFHNNKSYGFLVSLNSHINARIKRDKVAQPVLANTEKEIHAEEIPHQAGELF